MSHRWEISKRFLKYTKKLLQLPEEKLDELILTLHKGLREALESEDFWYFVENEHLFLDRGRLVRNKVEYPSQGFDCFKLGQDRVANQSHLLFVRANLLEGNKLEYVELLLQQYQMILAQTLAGTKPKSLEAEAQEDPKPLEGSIRAKYRKQKEVILALENFARRQHPKSQILQDLEALPDLEEEILKFQNQLIQELAIHRKKAFDARQEQERMSRFVLVFLEELSSRIALSLGLLRLFPPSGGKSGDFQTEKLAGHQLANLKTFCDAIVEALEAETQRGILTPQWVNAQELIHQSMRLIQESEEGQGMQISLDPSLSQHQMRVDLYSLRRALAFYFQFMAKLHRLSDSQESLSIKISSQEREEGRVLRLRAEGIGIDSQVLAQLQQPRSLFQALHAGGVAPNLLFYFIHQALARQGGRIQFLPREKAGVDCVIHLVDLPDPPPKGQKKTQED